MFSFHCAAADPNLHWLWLPPPGFLFLITSPH